MTATTGQHTVKRVMHHGREPLLAARWCARRICRRPYDDRETGSHVDDGEPGHVIARGYVTLDGFSAGVSHLRKCKP